MIVVWKTWQELEKDYPSVKLNEKTANALLKRHDKSLYADRVEYGATSKTKKWYYRVWRLVGPKLGGFSSTWLKATGRSWREAIDNHTRKVCIKRRWL